MNHPFSSHSFVFHYRHARTVLLFCLPYLMLPFKNAVIIATFCFQFSRNVILETKKFIVMFCFSFLRVAALWDRKIHVMPGLNLVLSIQWIEPETTRLHRIPNCIVYLNSYLSFFIRILCLCLPFKAFGVLKRISKLVCFAFTIASK